MRGLNPKEAPVRGEVLGRHPWEMEQHTQKQRDITEHCAHILEAACVVWLGIKHQGAVSAWASRQRERGQDVKASVCTLRNWYSPWKPGSLGELEEKTELG